MEFELEDDCTATVDGMGLIFEEFSEERPRKEDDIVEDTILGTSITF